MSVKVRMSFLDQMKLPGLISLSLILILASTSNGQGWNISVTRKINATKGSDVFISCIFTHPLEPDTEVKQVYWKKYGTKMSHITGPDKNAFVFHPNKTFVLEQYKGKTTLVGEIAEGNCTLKIENIQDNEPNIYVRVITNQNKYSFFKKYVTISLSDVDSDLDQVTPAPDIQLSAFTASTTVTPKETLTSWYIAIFVPVAVLLTLFFVAGIIFCISRKRSFVREDSGYYANFSRATSNQVNREASLTKKENKKFPDRKVIDEPVYINMQAPPDQMDQTMDHTDNIYANVDRK